MNSEVSKLQQNGRQSDRQVQLRIEIAINPSKTNIFNSAF